MQSLEKFSNKENKLKEEFEKQGFELVNVKFIDEETFLYVTRKIESRQK